MGSYLNHIPARIENSNKIAEKPPKKRSLALLTPLFPVYFPNDRPASRQRSQFGHGLPDRTGAGSRRPDGHGVEADAHDHPVQLERGGVGDAREHGLGRGKRQGLFVCCVRRYFTFTLERHVRRSIERSSEREGTSRRCCRVARAESMRWVHKRDGIGTKRLRKKATGLWC